MTHQPVSHRFHPLFTSFSQLSIACTFPRLPWLLVLTLSLASVAVSRVRS